MNVTVVVSRALRQAVDGRRFVELGLPASADVGDVVQSLLTLYPKLRPHLPNERKSGPRHLSLFLAEPPGRPGAANGVQVLREGQRLYLLGSPTASASPPSPQRSR